jgi:uncharacterized membrane protein YoaK (UPF0700 family)
MLQNARNPAALCETSTVAHRLPRWIEQGAFILAFAAGMVNAIALMGFNHQGVSHLSGIATLIGIEAAQTHAAVAWHLIAMILSFVVGAAASGVIVGSQPLLLGRHYAVCLFLEAALLLTALIVLTGGSSNGDFLAAAACGLQNAMTSTFTGSIVRTTHVTGVITDLGVALGLKLRGESIGPRRVVLYLLLVTGFVAGGAMGAFAFTAWGYVALGAPCALVCLSGIGALWLSPKGA